MSELRIFHGSNIEITKPVKEEGKLFNDYGKGFYCTKHLELAAQWACKFKEDGIVSEYIVNTDDLNILFLDEKYNILNWLAILVENREFTSETAIRNKQFIIDNYMIEYKDYDIIIGYRADDAYFKFVREFLTNQTGVITLDKAMYLGELGLQVFIQSEKAFTKISFIRSYEVDEEEYYLINEKAIQNAHKRYEELKVENMKSDFYIRQIIGGELSDESIPKIKIR